MKWWLGLICSTMCCSLEAAEPARPTVFVVVGAAGSDEYAPQFRRWAERWTSAAERGHADCHVIGLGEDAAVTDYERLKTELAELATDATEPVWLVLIGHGTFDGKTAKFNLRGPDLTPTDLQDWLKAWERPLAIVNCTSCSGPFLAELSGPGRVVITATRSAHEYNFAHFGDYLSSAIADPQADLDKDEQTSLLEAYLVASAGVREFYANDTRLETEHALLDDNGDKLGTPAEWFRGLRPTKSAKDGAALDGTRAHQFVLLRSGREEQLAPEVRARRDELERTLAELRLQQPQLSEEEYLQQLEPVLVEQARLYQAAESVPPKSE